jgi:hypothetical protein
MTILKVIAAIIWVVLLLSFPLVMFLLSIGCFILVGAFSVLLKLQQAEYDE